MESLLEQEFGNYQDDASFCHQGHEAGVELEFGGHPGSTVAVSVLWERRTKAGSTQVSGSTGPTAAATPDYQEPLAWGW